MTYSFWEKLSNYSILLCITSLIVHVFFKRYIDNNIEILWVWIIACILFLVTYVLSEVMKYIKK